MKKKYSPNKDYIYIRRPRVLYHIAYFITKLMTKPHDVEFLVQPTPKEKAVYVSNHCQAHGPIIFQLYFNERHGMPVNGRPRIWATSDLIIHGDSYRFFKHVTVRRSKRKLLWKILSAILSPLAVYIFRGAEIIPVYRSEKIEITHEKTIETLKEGKDVVIFPETPQRLNNYIHEFNIGFVDIGKKVYEEFGEKLAFYPIYIAPTIKKTKVGKPIYYDPDLDQYEQREKVIKYLEDEITKLGESMPPHKVIYFK